MEMDWGTAIIGLIAVLVFIIPFVIMYFKRVNNENRMLQYLCEIAQQRSCKISQQEFCGDFVLGIDQDKNYVFIFKQGKEGPVSQYVDLSEVKLCQVIKKTRIVKSYQGSPATIERIELGFIPSNKNIGETRFVLYDEDENTQLSGELQFADKWTNLLNAMLKSKK